MYIAFDIVLHVPRALLIFFQFFFILDHFY